MVGTVEILLDGPEALRDAQAFISRAAPAYWAKKRPLRLTVTSEEQQNTPAQKRLWNGPVLDAIAAQARWKGQRFPKEFWKEYFRKRFLLRDEYTTPDGEIMQSYWSTADRRFTVRMMSEFLDKVMADATTDWGVIFDA
jgi:hypothetical protein